MRRKFHPRIHPKNYPILRKHQPDHPAVRALQAHAIAQEQCVGKEIEWPQGPPPIEQKWHSSVRSRHESFSGVAYEFISYSLILDGWLELSAEPTAYEQEFLNQKEPFLCALLEECQTAAHADDNELIFPLISAARKYAQEYHNAIIGRFQQCNIRWPPTRSES